MQAANVTQSNAKTNTGRIFRALVEYEEQRPFHFAISTGALQLH
jgi:hypothetical protein